MGSRNGERLFPGRYWRESVKDVGNGRGMICAGDSVGGDGFFVGDDFCGCGQLLANMLGDSKHGSMGESIV
jgi:hypothetical protein